jgi:hypothetical protein
MEAPEVEKSLLRHLPTLPTFGTEAELLRVENDLASGWSGRENSVAQRTDTGQLLDRHSVESPMERQALYGVLSNSPLLPNQR